MILLILAGITINQLAGDNGLFKRAKEAKEKTEISSYKEQIELIRTELQMENEDYSLPTIYQMHNNCVKGDGPF